MEAIVKRYEMNGMDVFPLWGVPGRSHAAYLVATFGGNSFCYLVEGTSLEDVESKVPSAKARFKAKMNDPMWVKNAVRKARLLWKRT